MARITAADLRLASELVSYRVKIKTGESFVGCPASVFEAIYKALPEKAMRRPPNGLTRSPTSSGVPSVTQRLYAAMSCDFQKGLQLKVPRKDAVMAAFRHAWAVRGTYAGSDQLCINTWLDLVRNLQCGLAGLYRCRSCGSHILVEDHGQKVARLECPWCFRDSGMIDLTVMGARMAY